jgi:O-acetyl-ADP-ribose deacetylase (regulator of RNase III)
MVVYKECDIFDSGADVICHQVNCQGVMGSGLAKQVRERYPSVYKEYKSWCNIYKPEELLGKSQFVPLVPISEVANGNYQQGDLMGIINVFGQLDYGYTGKCYTDYEALRHAFQNLRKFCKTFLYNPVIAFPYNFGCARGGGDWEMVSAMIEDAFFDCLVFICKCDKG